MANQGRGKAVVAAALLLTGAVVLERLVRATGPTEARVVFPGKHPVVPAAGEGVSDVAAARPALNGGAPGDKSRGVEQPMSLDEFVGLLEASAPPAVAQEVARQFRTDPQLKAAWGVYQKVRGGKAPAREFIEYISRIPEFRKLVSKFQSDSAGQQAFAAIGSTPQLAAVVRGAMRFFSQPAARADDPRTEAIVREWRRKAMVNMDLSKYTVAAVGPFAAAAGRTRTPTATSATGAGAPTMPGVQAAGPGAWAGAAQGASGPEAQKGGAPPPGLKAGKNAHDVGRLDNGWKSRAVGDDANFADYRKWITQMLLALKEPTRRAVQAKLESGEEDLWGACYVTGNYDECKQVCRDVPEARCEDKDRWQACRSGATRDAKACVMACLGGDAKLACDPDLAEWDPLCADKSVPQGYCAQYQKYGPPVCDTAGNCMQDMGGYGGSVPPVLASGKGAAAPGAVICDENDLGTAPCRRLLALIAQAQRNNTAAPSKPLAKPKADGSTTKPGDAEPGDAELAFCPAPPRTPPDPDGMFERGGEWLGENMPIFGGDGLKKTLGDVGEKVDKVLDKITPW